MGAHKNTPGILLGHTLWISVWHMKYRICTLPHVTGVTISQPMPCLVQYSILYLVWYGIHEANYYETAFVSYYVSAYESFKELSIERYVRWVCLGWQRSRHAGWHLQFVFLIKIYTFSFPQTPVKLIKTKDLYGLFSSDSCEVDKD